MMQNRVPEAIDMFLMSVDYHNMVGCDWVDDPEPHPMKEDSRVIAACERMQEDFDRQSERVRALLEQYNVDTLLAPLMRLAENAK